MSANKEYYEPKKEKTKCEKIARAIWNPDKKEFLGRTASSWAKIIFAYILFYAFLAGFFAIMMFVFLRTLSLTRPRYTLKDSIIGTNPGLGFRPHVDDEKNLIYFNPNRPDTYAAYVDNLDKFLKGYETNDNTRGEQLLNCDDQLKTKAEQVCRVDIKKISQGCDRSTDFGYRIGTPCVLLKLNKIFGWKPETYSAKKIPNIIADSYDGRSVSVRCEGETAADRENIGDIQYYPKNGIPFHYFPYLNQGGYQQPFVMIKFLNPQRGVLVNIICRAYAANIVHDKPNEEVKLRGSVHFELLLD